MEVKSTMSINNSNNNVMWTTVLRIGITDDGGRHTLVCWRTSVDQETEMDHQMKCSVVLFQCLGNGDKFRIMANGTKQNDDGEDSSVFAQELRLTNRAPWVTAVTKLLGATSRARMVEVDFAFADGEASERDLVRLEIVVPKTSNSDKGKILKLSLDWAKAEVDAKILKQKLSTALLQMVAN